MTEREISISTTELNRGTNWHRIVYTFTTDHGMLDGTFSPEARDFCIANVDVDSSSRRQGIAKALVSSAIEEAKDIGALIIYAGLISRESIDLMTSVFGSDVVQVRNEGTYTPEGEPDKSDASGVLWVELDKHNPAS
jgi:GNAT superfamily N-acetyltransferase